MKSGSMLLRQQLAKVVSRLPVPIERVLRTTLERSRDARRARTVRKLASITEMEDVSCALCETRDVIRHTVRNGFKIVCCRTDGLIFASPRPVDVAPFYDERYYDGDMICGYRDYESHARDYVTSWHGRLDTLEGLVGSPGRLLDVGSATGVFLDLARAQGWDVSGVELSSWAVQYSRDSYAVPVLQGSLPDDRIATASQDVVTLFDCIEHLTDPRGVLSDIHRILRPGGLLMISTGSVPHRDPQLVSKWYYPPWHLFYFSRETILMLLKACGFDLISYIEENEHMPEYKLMVVLARRSDV